ncbi:RNA polymerase sigma factor [Oceanobacillus salinisoli]|uniref:RNA polymerase sigma factor n=1 Tax=Oceanobacillus salinisoli TaxID=2678611 RepID=UPI0012E12D77|nr:RNA polymerase sigma factor [Oceanobacillus salinisoli]
MKSKLLFLLNSNFASLNEEIQEEVYRDFYHLFYPLVVYMIKDHSAAEDIVQDAFIKTIYSTPQIESETQLIAWIKVVTKNLTLNYIRKNKKIRNQEDMESVFISEMDYHAETVESEVEGKILEENIKTSLLEIYPDYRVLIELKWKKQKSNKEIAERLGTTEGAVKQKLHRAREALKNRLKRKWGVQDE